METGHVHPIWDALLSINKINDIGYVTLNIVFCASTDQFSSKTFSGNTFSGVFIILIK